MTDKEIRNLYWAERHKAQLAIGDRWTHEEVDCRALRVVFEAGRKHGLS